MTNERIASTFERIAMLLEDEDGSPFHAQAWREAATAVRDYPSEVSAVFRDHGHYGLEAIVGSHRAAVIVELLETGTCVALELLERARGLPGLPSIHAAPTDAEPDATRQTG